MVQAGPATSLYGLVQDIHHSSLSLTLLSGGNTIAALKCPAPSCPPCMVQCKTPTTVTAQSLKPGHLKNRPTAPHPKIPPTQVLMPLLPDI